MQLLVWMAGWQMACCGTPFATGAEVSWRLRPPTDVGWLATVLPPVAGATVDAAEGCHLGAGATVDAVEDHHLGAGNPPTAGTVVSIATVHCRFDPEPVVRSGLLTPVAEAERWNDDAAGRQFAGFLVRLRTAHDHGSRDLLP